jgi:hypothetical protein
MNLALVSVLIFLFILPGILARLAYFTHPFSRGAANITLLNELTYSIFPGLLINLIGVLIAESITGNKFLFDEIGYILEGSNKDSLVKLVFDNLHNHIGAIIYYNLSINIVSILIGRGLNSFVRWRRWDTRFNFLRFNNKWYYLLTGRYLDFPHIPGSSDEVDIILVDILTMIGNEPVLYMGELSDYYLNDKGELDGITLKFPIRKKMDTTNTTPAIGNYYQIPSRVFYISCKDILNINLRYFKAETKSQPSK